VARTLALDLGRARIGVAIDDELGSMAHARGVFDARDRPKFLGQLAAMVKDEGVERIIVGFPVDLRGHEGDAARNARAMAQLIADATQVSVELWDERMTTMAAARSLTASGLTAKQAKTRIDEASAVEILESWLGSRKKKKKKPDGVARG
jgi:putative Holliday junction resolvase